MSVLAFLLTLAIGLANTELLEELLEELVEGKKEFEKFPGQPVSGVTSPNGFPEELEPSSSDENRRRFALQSSANLATLLASTAQGVSTEVAGALQTNTIQGLMDSLDRKRQCVIEVANYFKRDVTVGQGHEPGKSGQHTTYWLYAGEQNGAGPLKTVNPGKSDAVQFANMAWAWKGTAGVMALTVSHAYKPDQHYHISVMWSVPHSTWWYDRWFGVAISRRYIEPDEELWENMYYNWSPKECIDHDAIWHTDDGKIACAEIDEFWGTTNFLKIPADQTQFMRMKAEDGLLELHHLGLHIKASMSDSSQATLLLEVHPWAEKRNGVAEAWIGKTCKIYSTNIMRGDCAEVEVKQLISLLAISEACKAVDRCRGFTWVESTDVTCGLSASDGHELGNGFLLFGSEGCVDSDKSSWDSEEIDDELQKASDKCPELLYTHFNQVNPSVDDDDGTYRCGVRSGDKIHR